ncbi:MAG: hypothetical protein JWN79_1720 [Gemmatimonadetes bacterium]|nr:hypothetical protein [Gemmatimonadota bacterium]
MTFAHVPPRLPRPVVFDQLWADLTFLHWAVDPADVTPYLPPGTRPDVFSDGATYVGLVPFLMASAGPGTKLPIPYFGRFLETNIRLYSVDDAGRHGVVFRSLDATRLAVVLLARWGIRIPYQWSSISLSSAGPVRVYRTERRWPRPRVTSEVAVEIGAPTEATPVEEFLTRRWGMHSRLGRRTMWTPNRHDPWVLHEASLRHLDDGLGAAAGFPLNGAPTLRPLWTPGVRTQFGRPTLI